MWFSFIDHGRGVSCFDGECFTTYTIEDGLLSNWANSIIQDREGQFWVSHWDIGLTCFDSETLQFLTEEPVRALIQDSQGRLWFKNDRNELCCLDEGQQRCQSFNVETTSRLEDTRRRFWVATSGEGLFCYDSADAVWEDGEGTPVAWAHYTVEDGLGSNYVRGLLEASDGTIWFTHPLSPSDDRPGCLCCFRGQQFSALPIPHGKIYALIEDSLGRIWMGGVGSWGESWGLSCYDAGRPQGLQLRTYTTAEGLPDDGVYSIIEDDAGNLWIGTEQGLCCFDGKRFRAYGTEQGLPNTKYVQSAKDTTGRLWFGSIGGLYRIDGEHFQTLTTADGLPSNQVTGLVPQPDGSMIIGTGRGIVHYRPTATMPPPIEIREVIADAVYQNPTEIQIIAVGESHASPLLTISYHSLSFATKKMRYSYILEGYDKDWQDTWERSVRYENLPEGQYTFKVIAINRDLVKSETPAQLALTIVPDPRDLEIATLRTEVAHFRREVSGKYDFSNLIGRSAAIKQVHLLMERAIDSGLNVLITGETGTSKELVANGIHYNSTRGNQTPVTCDCGTLSKDLAASELFGHRKGAFTGAHEDKIGLFEAANGNTLILDEIGNMPLDVQQNLLRVLEERKVQRVGETTTRDVDVRVIAITNLDLEKEKEAGRFREDLYYRLNEFPIPLPPLRERREDIPLLAEYLLREIDKDIDGFAPGVLEMLQSYNWPGNVRELQKTIRLAAAFAEEGEHLETYHFSLQISQGESLIQEVMGAVGQKPSSYRELVNQFERRCIEHALAACNGNRTQAAKMLGLHRTQLIKRMRDLNIEYSKA